MYLPKEDVLLTCGDGVWTWNASENAWHSIQVTFDSRRKSAVGQNRAIVYDSKRDVVFLVLDDGVAQIYGLRYGRRE